ncbi:CHAT domain-containing protein [Streptomyces atriruber]|uniref:CHAT domain-containing protein n=1 Tax=Streptomyces atriruber TaxID=545121 RepID=UPI000A96B516|nr:CHAT domain-containing protein [Streptomyces atriruber]
MLDEHSASLTMRLLVAATFDEAMALIDAIPADSRAPAAELIRGLTETAGESSPAAVELHHFLARLCLTEEMEQGERSGAGTTAPSTESASPPEAAPADFAALLALAAPAPDLLAARRILLRHGALLPEQPVRTALPLLRKLRLPPDDQDRVVGALTAVSADVPDRITGHIHWAEAMVRQQRRRRARFHAARAVALQEVAGDTGSLIFAYLTLAITLVELNDRTGARHALLRGLRAGRTAGSPPAELSYAHSQLAHLLIIQEMRYQDGLEHLDAVDALTAEGAPPPLPEETLLEMRGRALEGVGAYGAAARTYRRILWEAEPHARETREQATYFMARSIGASGRLREAVRLLMAQADATETEGETPMPQIRHQIAEYFVLENAPHRRRPAAHMLLLSLMGAAGRKTWVRAGEVFLTLGDLARNNDCPEEAALYYREAIVLSTGLPGDGETEPGEAHQVPVTDRMLGFHPDRSAENRRELSEVLTFICEQVRKAIGATGQLDVPMTRIRLLALERLARVAPTEEARADHTRELLERYARALADDEWFIVRDLYGPVAELLTGRRGPAAAERHLRATLAAAERHDRDVDTTGIRLALARTLTAPVPGPDSDSGSDPLAAEARREAFDQLWHCRRLLLAQRAGDHDAHSTQEWAGQALPVYEELLTLLLGAHGEEDFGGPRGDEAQRLAFDLHEEVKSRGIVEDLSRLPLPRPAGADPRLAEDEERLLPSIRRMLREADRPGAADPHRQRVLSNLRKDLAEKAAALGRSSPDHARLRRFRGVTADTAHRLVQRHAPAEGLVLASYFIGERHSFCFVIASGDGRLRTHRLSVTRAGLHAAADSIRRTVDGDPDAFPPRPKIHPRRPAPLPLDELSGQLLPFHDLLAGRELLCIAPHGPLAVLPLHALRLPDGAYVAERAALVYTPSVSALEYLLLHEPAPPGRVLRVDVASLEDLAATDVAQGFDDTVPPGPAGPGHTDLTGTAATPETVLAALAEHDLAYIACHGHSGDGEPGDAALILTDGHAHASMHASPATPEALPFLLRARDIGTTFGTPKTVVLRACSAGWHDPAHLGEDFTGLTQALFREGTRTVVAPIWRVNQHSSAELLDGIARDRMAGEPLWKALWRAQRRLMTDGERPWLAHPYHWAGFVPLGDWR